MQDDFDAAAELLAEVLITKRFGPDMYKRVKEIIEQYSVVFEYNYENGRKDVIPVKFTNFSMDMYLYCETTENEYAALVLYGIITTEEMY